MRQTTDTFDTYLAATTKLTNKTLTSPVINTSVSQLLLKMKTTCHQIVQLQLATQQSIKAYVDTQLTAEDLDLLILTLSIDLDSNNDLYR